jgi:periplasmic protein TonB
MENAGFYVLGAFAIATGFYAVSHRDYLMLSGAIAAALVHAGLLFGDQVFGRASRPPLVNESPVIALDDFKLPDALKPDDPEPPPPAADTTEPVKVEMAPPSLPERPGIARDGGFTQRLTSPPPVGTIGGDMRRIPTNPPSIGTGGPITVDQTQLKVKPRPTYQVQPVYPPELKREGITGTVVLGFIVDASGTARDVQVLSATHPGFVQAAIQALQKWRFSPGKFKGQAVHTRNVQQSIRFSLNEN